MILLAPCLLVGVLFLWLVALAQLWQNIVPVGLFVLSGLLVAWVLGLLGRLYKPEKRLDR